MTKTSLTDTQATVGMAQIECMDEEDQDEPDTETLDGLPVSADANPEQPTDSPEQ